MPSSQRTRELFAAAINLDESQVADFLTRSCGDDQDLQDEISNMVSAYRELEPRMKQALSDLSLGVDSFVDRRSEEPFEPSVPSRVGTTIGRYEVVDRIGRGGMGTVYRARDVELGRDVAIKILPELVSVDERVKSRFVNEAKAIARIEHPNVCSIYDVGELAGGELFIVMPYYDGSTVAQQLERVGRIPLAEALDIGVQVSAGLEAAHHAGIVHRDIKPENLMLTRDGVRVLDFGLAKGSDLSLTQTGTLLGTAPYMSPEQVTGGEVDVRSDVWGLGAVLYQMISGRRPFSGLYMPAVIYEILNTQPRLLESLDPELDVPRFTSDLIARALSKKKSDRFGSMSEMRAALHEARRQAIEEPDPSGRRLLTRFRWRQPRWLRVAVPLVLLALGWLLGAGLGALGPDSDDVLHSHHLTDSGGLAINPTWSPGGEWVAYAAASRADQSLDIWKKSVITGERVRLTAVPGDARDPAWSPSGDFIAYTRADSAGIFTMAASGGGEGFPTIPRGRYPAWSPDETWLLYEADGVLYRARAAGITPPDSLTSGMASRSYAHYLDDESVLLWDRSHRGLCVIHTATKDHRQLGVIKVGHEVKGLDVLPGGEAVIYAAGQFGGRKDIFMQRLDSGDWTPVGEPMLIIANALDDVDVSISSSRQLAYSAREIERRLMWVRRDPRTGDMVGTPTQVTQDARINYFPNLSGDGRRAVWTRQDGAEGLLYTKILPDGEEMRAVAGRISAVERRETQATFDPQNSSMIAYSSHPQGRYQLFRSSIPRGYGAELTRYDPTSDDFGPRWSPDGGQIAFYSNRDDNFDIWIVPRTGESESGDNVRQVTRSPSTDMYPVWHPTDNKLLFHSTRSGNGDLYVHDLETGTEEVLEDGPAVEIWGTWSPDGRWLYFVSDRTGTYQIWRRLAAGGEAVQLTSYGQPRLGLSEDGLLTRFDVSGRFLLYVEEERSANIMRADLSDLLAQFGM